ncbi:uncharacterized protein LOC143289581 [Babylonia areolata]|uniref:uncharacterized protein LOC143289581 n=1 Tax=Babylonia areolata TaxID=304850 RepID=UPI003FCFCCB7
MAFSLTFSSILDNNIRHVYSGMPVQMSYRHSSEYPNMDQLRQRRENQQLKNFVLRTSEYQSDFNCLIPRAPAFRILSRHEVDDIVKRLQRETVASTRQDGASESRTVKEKEKNNPKYLGLKKVSQAEIEEITERVNKPTKMSTIREKPRNPSDMPQVA